MQLGGRIAVGVVAMRGMTPIPIAAAEAICKEYGYDQVIVIGRRVGAAPAPHGEHCTTYGVTAEHAAVAARCGDMLKHKVMGWPDATPEEQRRKHECLHLLRKFARLVQSEVFDAEGEFLARDLEAIGWLQKNPYSADGVNTEFDYVLTTLALEALQASSSPPHVEEGAAK